MSAIADRIRKSRRFSFKIGDVTLFGSRASLEQALQYNNRQLSDAQICRNHIVDWDGVKESDLIDGGSDLTIPFDRDDFSEVIGNKKEWWPFAGEIVKDALDRVTERQDNQKKSKSG